MVGTGKAAENGILIKSAESLELAHSINAIVLDKTGTITVGKPQVNDIFVFNNMQEGELLKIVGAIESKSEHPIAKAILEKTKEVEALEAQNFEAIEGKEKFIETTHLVDKVFDPALNIQHTEDIIINHLDAAENQYKQKLKEINLGEITNYVHQNSI
mgnify:CR=1 FL=1